MKVVYITYADNNFRRQGQLSVILARLTNFFDEVKCYKPTDIDESFKFKNREIFFQSRGGGYWIWKPYILSKKVDELSYGDVLLYVDAGAHLIRSPKKLIDFFMRQNQDVAAFQLPLIEKQWTKEKCFDIITRGSFESAADSNQVQASFILIKKTERSVEFLEQYLFHCQNKDLILDDNASEMFGSYLIEHRHDQSIFSLLYKNYDFTPFEDVSHRGLNPATYALSNFSGRVPDDILRKNYNTYFRISTKKLNFKWRFPFFLFARKQRFTVSLILFILRYIGCKIGVYKGLVC